MGLRIQNNIEAFNTHRQLNATAAQASKSMEKLSSGYRINRAADDAAGLGISEKMRGQIGGLAQAQRNANDAISLVQTAEGALNETHSILQRMRTLAVQSANDTNTSDDRGAIQKEVAALNQELDRIAGSTEFNGQKLLNGAGGAAADGKFTFQVGANATQTIDVTFAKSGTGATELNTTGVDVSTQAGASTALTTIDAAIKSVSTQRADLGAVQNRLQHTINSLSVAAENASAAESRIRDTDMAKEMTSFTRAQILQQAGVSMLAQANSATQSVLKLLG